MLVVVLPVSVWAGPPEFAAPPSLSESSDDKGAVTYEVDNWTIDNGGGFSSGGVFSIEGTIGQPDADPLQPSEGGAFAISGGFWGAPAPSEPPGDKIFADGFEALVSR